MRNLLKPPETAAFDPGGTRRGWNAPNAPDADAGVRRSSSHRHGTGTALAGGEGRGGGCEGGVVLRMGGGYLFCWSCICFAI